MKKKERSYHPVALNLHNARIAAGFDSISEAARFIGVPVPTAVAHEGAGKSFRKPKLDQLRRYATAYHTTIDALEGGTIVAPPKATVAHKETAAFKNMVAAPILGTAQAGKWVGADPLAGEAKAFVNVKPGKQKLFAVVVMGDSMNRIIQDGDIAIVTPWSASAKPGNNATLLVQRERDGSFELSVKTYRDGQLYPESTNPKWRHPLPLRDGDTIRIVGQVVGLYRSL